MLFKVAIEPDVYANPDDIFCIKIDTDSVRILFRQEGMISIERTFAPGSETYQWYNRCLRNQIEANWVEGDDLELSADIRFI